MIDISVIIPAYNAAATLAATLDSLCAQTFNEWEAIVVDDGSSDETPRT
jgi:glycosyltransferase involved in cell wall biosynthesis